MVDRARYLLAHGCKEGLVARPAEWPGVSSLVAMRTGEPMRGTWFDRTAEWHARRRGTSSDPRAFAEPTELELVPLPCWRHRGLVEQRTRVEALVQDIERETSESNRALGRLPPGVRFVLSQDPHSRSGPRKARQVQAARRVILLASSSTGVRYSSAEWIRSSL